MTVSTRPDSCSPARGGLIHCMDGRKREGHHFTFSFNLRKNPQNVVCRFLDLI